MLSEMKYTHHEPPATARQPFIVNQQGMATWSPWRDSHSGRWVREGHTGVNGSESSALPGAGRGTGWEDCITVEAQRLDVPTRKRRRWRGTLPPRLSTSVLHSAVASQLVPRGTWRHLVSVSTGAGTADGCGRFSSVPLGVDEAADARLQGVTGAVTPEWEEPGERFPYTA